jgi:hypothetical protein
MKVQHRPRFSDPKAAVAYGQSVSETTGQNLVLELIIGVVAVGLAFGGGLLLGWWWNRKATDAPEPDGEALDSVRDQMVRHGLFEKSYIIREVIINILSFLSPSEATKAINALADKEKGTEMTVPRTLLTDVHEAMAWIKEECAISFDEEAYQRRWNAGLDRVNEEASARVLAEGPSTEERGLEMQEKAMDKLSEFVRVVEARTAQDRAHQNARMERLEETMKKVAESTDDSSRQVMAQIKDAIASGDIVVPPAAPKPAKKATKKKANGKNGGKKKKAAKKAAPAAKGGTNGGTP